MNKISVLLIEDADDIRFLMKAGLERDGYYVEECINAAAAMQELKKGFKPHVILLDLMLPDGNGLEVLLHLKRSVRRDGVIVLSAKETLESRIEALQIGADRPPVNHWA